MPQYMYVSVSGDDKLLVFTVDAGTGKLEPRGEVIVPGRPAPMAMDPGHRFLYVGRRDAREVSAYRINPSNGELSFISAAPLESDPVWLAMDRNGRFLLSTYYNAGSVAVHAIGIDGKVCTPPIEWLKTATGAHSIQTDPNNRFAFVPHIAGAGPNVILQFKFDETTGHLTPNSPDRVFPEKDAGPRDFCFHPHLDVLYFTNEEGSSVTAFQMDNAGTLSLFQTISTLPDDYKDWNHCSQIQMSPSGWFLYAANRGHNSIASFSVDTVSGRLTPIERVPTEPLPRSFSLTPDGRFLFAVGQESGNMASFQVNAQTGKLTRLETYTLGKAPMWVLITRISG